jgi:hypothetical protein
MATSVLQVITQAMRSHDDRARFWLQEINNIQRQAATPHHAKALQQARQYLEELINRGGEKQP